MLPPPDAEHDTRLVLMRTRITTPVTVVTTLPALAALLWLAFGFFGVHRTFVDDLVDEAAPSRHRSRRTTGARSRASTPDVGRVSVLGDGAGGRFVRLESFRTDNGPDLDVHLVNHAAEGVDDTAVICCTRFASPSGEAALVAA